MARKLFAEWIGTAFLLAVVVGSGIMADRLADGHVALALLGNAIPTGAILAVPILILGPISGAHFNPAVTLVFTLQGTINLREAGAYFLDEARTEGIVGGHGVHDRLVEKFFAERSGLAHRSHPAFLSGNRRIGGVGFPGSSRLTGAPIAASSGWRNPA